MMQSCMTRYVKSKPHALKLTKISDVHCHFVLLQTGGQLLVEEKSHLGVSPLYLEQLDFAQYCYDATWTLVYALNQTINGNM